MDKRFLIFIAFGISFLGLFYYFIYPKEKTYSANFTSATAVLSNARFSYRAGVSSGTSGSSTVTIDSSGNADNDTDHLFPDDNVCFVGSLETGCLGNTNYDVTSITDDTNFEVDPSLSTTLEATSYVVSTQSGSLTLNFTTVTVIPSNGDLLITIPAVDANGKTNDGIPDTGNNVHEGGFDIQNISTSDISITGCTDSNWTIVGITPGDATNDHEIEIDRTTSTCASGTTITVTIDSDPGIINPAPLLNHTEGQADSYRLNIKSRDGSGDTLDKIDVLVAPIEGVLISATVEELLSLTVSGITSDSGTYCGVTRTASSPDTTAVLVPWGTLSRSYSEDTNNTAHEIEVYTNASSGYKLYAEENDQMGKDGKTCSGSGAGESLDCIQDTLCNGSDCSHQTYRDWSNPNSYPGLGYSIQNVVGTDALFEYNTLGSTFNAKQFADQEASESKSASNAELMSNSGPIESSSIYLCYRIDITDSQPAGYYYNRVKYTLIPNF